MKVLVVFHSMYGHVHRMAEAVAEGVREVPGAVAELRRLAETLPGAVPEKTEAPEARKAVTCFQGRHVAGIAARLCAQAVP